MKLIKQLLGVAALLLATSALAGHEGAAEDYTMVNPPQPTSSGTKIEVLEFFFYGCSHCFKLHPLISEWEKKLPKDVALVYVPTIFNPAWEPMARTYYALESIGQLKQLHDELFNAWNVNNIDLTDEAKITDFVAKHGVDRKKFSDAYNAFAMQGKLMRSKQMASAYGIRGTPTVTVDGKYVITGLQPKDTIRVLDTLIDKVRKERAGNKGQGQKKATPKSTNQKH